MRTDDVDVKLAFARQAGDEAKHYRLIADRLRELGFDASGFDPLAKGYGPLFQYLDSLETTVERVAAGQFTREAIAVVKNRQFIEFCERAGDDRHRHPLSATSSSRTSASTTSWAAGCCSASPPARRRRRPPAARRPGHSSLAEELQTAALRTAGIHHAPGC